jgi:hypothetical protein
VTIRAFVVSPLTGKWQNYAIELNAEVRQLVVLLHDRLGHSDGSW